MVNLQKLDNYKNYGRCVKLTNGIITAVVTVEVGPRIIFFGYTDGQNIMNDDRLGLGGKECDRPYAELFGKGRRWENLGGHRIWLSPESYPETYTPDDKPCKVVPTESGALFIYAEDTEICAQKEMELKLDPDDTNMQVIMRVKNISSTPREFAVWSLSVCAQNGTLIIPMNTVDTGLLPNRHITFWPYTDPTADNYFFGKKYTTVKQIPAGENYAGKLGFDLDCGTVYYVLNDDILCKSYETYHPNAVYPDGNSSFETYVCNAMLEIETLSELKMIASGEVLEHAEHWSLCKKPCEADLKSDASIDKMLGKI